MSSNMYGFTCTVPGIGDRTCFIQVCYIGTGYDDNDTLYRLSWGDDKAEDLARYELDHRDWESKEFHTTVRIGVWGCYSNWIEEDETLAEDVNYTPPVPTEREILQMIANYQAWDIEYGWDT